MSLFEDAIRCIVGQFISRCKVKNDIQLLEGDNFVNQEFAIKVRQYIKICHWILKYIRLSLELKFFTILI